MVGYGGEIRGGGLEWRSRIAVGSGDSYTSVALYPIAQGMYTFLVVRVLSHINSLRGYMLYNWIVQLYTTLDIPKL